MIFYKEYTSMTLRKGIFFSLGVCVTISGVLLLSQRDIDSPADKVTEKAAARARISSTTGTRNGSTDFEESVDEDGKPLLSDSS